MEGETVCKEENAQIWSRFLESRLDGLVDEARPGMQVGSSSWTKRPRHQGQAGWAVTGAREGEARGLSRAVAAPPGV